MKRVLIADDSECMRSMLKTILKDDLIEIVGEAENGREAVEKYETLHPDLVLMDLAMPGVDGMQALEEIIKLSANAKVIICSIMGQQEFVVQALKAGAAAFIIKPFRADKVLQIVQKNL